MDLLRRCAGPALCTSSASTRTSGRGRSSGAGRTCTPAWGRGPPKREELPGGKHSREAPDKKESGRTELAITLAASTGTRRWAAWTASCRGACASPAPRRRTSRCVCVVRVDHVPSSQRPVQAQRSEHQPEQADRERVSRASRQGWRARDAPVGHVLGGREALNHERVPVDVHAAQYGYEVTVYVRYGRAVGAEEAIASGRRPDDGLCARDGPYPSRPHPLVLPFRTARSERP